ncbi:MAG: extracellular solute-binding protein, partial [Candidatus Methylomirabilales bacterium]
MYVWSHRPRLALPVLLSVQALLVAVLLAGCGRSGQALEVYSGRGENLVGPLLDQFTEDSGIAVKVRYGDSADLALLIAEEGRRTPADVFFSQSPGAVGFLSEGGLLAPLDQDLLDRVDPRFRNSGGRWVAVSGRQRVLVYNRDRVKEADLPESVFDLTGASYAGKVAVAPQNASFQDFITAMRQIKGDEATLSWLTAMARNRSPTYASNNAIVSAVARGEVPF